MPNIVVPDKFKEVKEFNFVFTSGADLPFSLDEGAGDKLVDLPDRLEIYFSEKPNMLNPEEVLKPEKVTVFKQGLAAIHERLVLRKLPTPEDLYVLKQFIHPEANTVQ